MTLNRRFCPKQFAIKVFNCAKAIWDYFTKDFVVFSNYAFCLFKLFSVNLRFSTVFYNAYERLMMLGPLNMTYDFIFIIYFIFITFYDQYITKIYTLIS